MKKLALTVVATLLLLTAFQGKAQKVYQEGTNIFNAGLGVGYYGYGLAGTRSFSFPAATANFELGVHKYIGVGPYVGFQHWSYNAFGYKYGFSVLAVGARGSFHFSTLLKEDMDMEIDDSKWDLYATLLMGLEFQSYNGDLGTYGYSNSTVFRIGPTIGARYYFSPGFGGFMEVGRGAFSWLTLGVSVKM